MRKIQSDRKGEYITEAGPLKDRIQEEKSKNKKKVYNTRGRKTTETGQAGLALRAKH